MQPRGLVDWWMGEVGTGETVLLVSSFLIVVPYKFSLRPLLGPSRPSRTFSPTNPISSPFCYPRRTSYLSPDGREKSRPVRTGGSFSHSLTYKKRRRIRTWTSFIPKADITLFVSGYSPRAISISHRRFRYEYTEGTLSLYPSLLMILMLMSTLRNIF